MIRLRPNTTALAVAVAALSLFALPACAERVQFDPTFNHVVCDSGCGSPLSFTPTAGATASLSVSTTSADVALPAGATIVVTNTGATDAVFRIQTGAGTAVTTDMVLKAGAAVGLSVGSATHISAITASSTTTLNIQGGSGGVAGYGGGGSGGGGGGPATVADGADVAEGAKADAAYAGSGSASVVAILKGIFGAATGGIPTGANSIGTVGLNAGTALVGKVGLDQTTPGTTNGVVVNNTTLAMTAADGSSVALGSKADAATCATTNTLIACARQLHTDMTGSIPTGTNSIGTVGLNAGTNLVGKFGIDQTTPGTTNGVQVNAALPAGTNLMGKVGLDQTTPGTTNLVAAGGVGAANAAIAGNPVREGCTYATATTAATTGQTQSLACDPMGNLALAAYGPMQTAETAASGNVANASAVATLATAAGKTTYISGFRCQAAGSTAASVVSLTVAGVITGTMTYTFVFPAGATVAATPVGEAFSKPIPASAANTTIVVTLPAGGTGNTNASCAAYGFQQ